MTAAKRLLEKTAFDLILSDLRLPDDDGITLLPWKKEQGIDAPLIIMTSYADIQNAVLAMKEGASDYVSKPIKPDLLLQKINDALANGTTADNDVAEKPATDSADDSDPDFLRARARRHENCTAWCRWWLPPRCRCLSTARAAQARNM